MRIWTQIPVFFRTFGENNKNCLNLANFAWICIRAKITDPDPNLEKPVDPGDPDPHPHPCVPEGQQLRVGEKRNKYEAENLNE